MSVRNCNEKGFTLLEMMVALAIVAIALVSLLGLSNRSILVQERVQRLTRGTLLAQQILSEEQVASGSTRSWSPREDVFAEPYGDFRWQISYQETLINNIKEVTVTVIWGEPAKNEQVRLTSFLIAEEGG